ncbi:MAG: VWA domain-containing protein, partial [Anaerolineae bacterium]|nr:VWA domain-containing protein [Anaerolineae bacterium]
NVTARTGQPHVKQFVEERELTVMLVVDASGSGDFASEGQFKRELAAELASVLSFAATTNKDKVGLLIFTDQVELFIPPRKGRRHVLRLIRELLAFEPQGDGTDIKLALDTINQILKRRSILFLVSDFLDDPERYQQVLHMTNRKHDVIAIDLHDPLERDIANVGLLTLEDAETGELIWVDTADREWRTLFHNQVDQFETRKNKAFANAAVDQVSIHTDQDYFKALTLFFEKRAKRIRY